MKICKLYCIVGVSVSASIWGHWLKLFNVKKENRVKASLTCCFGSSHTQTQQQDVCTCGGFCHRWSWWYCYQNDGRLVRQSFHSHEFKLWLTSTTERDIEDLPETVSAAGGDPFRILMAPRDAENTVLTVLWWGEGEKNIRYKRSVEQKLSGMFCCGVWGTDCEQNRYVFLFISFLCKLA